MCLSHKKIKATFLFYKNVEAPTYWKKNVSYFCVNFSDSGVETGNDSNDSLVAQLDNNMQATPVATFNQLQLSNFHHHSTSASSMFNCSSEKNVQDTMQIIDAAPSEAVSQDKVSEASQTSTSTNTSLISVSTFNSGPFFSLALLPAENKAKINTPNMVYNDYFLFFHKDTMQ